MASVRPVIKVDDKSLECLYPDRLLDGLVISAYLRLLERRSRFNSYLPSVHAFDTTFFKDWEAGGYDKTKARVDGFDPFNFEVLLFPVHVPSLCTAGHWALVVARPNIKTVRAFDSLRISRAREMNMVLAFLERAAMDRERRFNPTHCYVFETPADYPKQTDRTSCGVYLLAYAEAAATCSTLRGLLVDVIAVRKRIQTALRASRTLNEDFDIIEGNPVLERGLRFGQDGRSPAQMMRITIRSGPEPEIVDLTEDPVSFRRYVSYETAPMFKAVPPIEGPSPRKVEITEVMDDDQPEVELAENPESESRRSESPALSIMIDPDQFMEETELNLQSEGASSMGITTTPALAKVEERMSTGEGEWKCSICWDGARLQRMEAPLPMASIPKPRKRRRSGKYVRVRRQRDDGSYYRVKLLKRGYQ